MSDIYCTNCGAKAQDSQRFCANCGANIGVLQPAKPDEIITLPVIVHTLTGLPLIAHASLTYAVQAKTVELVDETAKLPPLKFDFNVDSIYDIARFKNNSILLTVWPKGAESASMFRIEFPDEVAATAFLNANPKNKAVGDDKVSQGSHRGLATTTVWPIAGLIVVVAALLAWYVPTGHSDVTHHDAVSNPLMATKAYDEGADFYLFNRCKMYVLVDGEKYSFPGTAQNDECTLANPADALKLMAYTRAGNN
jgi:hypothetical protein